MTSQLMEHNCLMSYLRADMYSEPSHMTVMLSMLVDVILNHVWLFWLKMEQTCLVSHL